MEFERACSRYGSPANPAILLLHGIRLGRVIWETHAHALADRYHVITVDLPGHGALVDLSFTDANLDALMDYAIGQAVGPPLLAGYSLGGFAAMRYASTHPGRTAGLFLADCTLDFSPWKAWPFEAASLLACGLPASVFDRLTWASLHALLPWSWAELIGGIPFDRRVFEHMRRVAHDRTHFTTMLSNYLNPVLFVNGEYDLTFRLDERRFLAAVPQSKLELIRRADHTAPMTRAHEFTMLLAGFAARVFGG